VPVHTIVNREQPIGLLATHNVRTGVDTLEEVPSSRPRKAQVVSTGQVQAGSVVGGRYEIEKFVAAGSFGAVYRANDLEVPGHVVALKLMHRPPASEQEEALCRREVQLIAAVSHPSVVSFKDHGFHQGRFYIVMPWFEGETLASRLRGDMPLTRHEARRIFQQLAQALSAMHARGIRHQDVKPENILLARFGEGQEDFPVLLDLGVGAFSHELVPGFTPAYVAPEMARAHLELMKATPTSKVDGKADVFALALTLFDAIAPGAREFSACDGSPASLLIRAQQGVELPRVPALLDVDAALRRFMAVDPEERPTAAELVRELSVLTRADERRAERKRMALRAGPFVSAAVALSVVLGMKLADVHAEARVKDSRIEQQAAQIDSAREELEGVSAERIAQLAAFAKAQAANDELGSRVDEAYKKAQALKQRLAAEQREVAATRSKLDGEAARAVELGLALENQRQAVAQLEQERATLQAAVARSEDMRKQLTASLEVLRRDKERLEASQQKLASHNDKLSSERDRLERERDRLRERESKLERELSALESERDRLVMRANLLERERKAVVSSLKEAPKSDRQLVLDRLRRRSTSDHKPLSVM
jgi:hypothetical protein